MTKQQRSRPSATPAVNPAAAAVDLFSDFGREQMAMAMDATSVMFRGFEAMRRIQQDAAGQASARHEAAARELREMPAGANLMAIPLAVLQADLASMSSYWQALAAAASETQSEMMTCTCQLSGAQSILESAAAWEALGVVPGSTNFFPLVAGEPL
jgi:hypothetical protein